MRQWNLFYLWLWQVFWASRVASTLKAKNGKSRSKRWMPAPDLKHRPPRQLAIKQWCWTIFICTAKFVGGLEIPCWGWSWALADFFGRFSALPWSFYLKDLKRISDRKGVREFLGDFFRFLVFWQEITRHGLYLPPFSNCIDQFCICCLEYMAESSAPRLRSRRLLSKAHHVSKVTL